MKAVRKHLLNNVVGYLALVVALSSGAYAAGLAPNSVKSKHIRDGAVQSVDVRDGGLTGVDVKNDSLDGFDIHDLSYADMQDNTLTGQQIDESTLGIVPNALIAGHGGFGRTSPTDTSCDPEGDTVEDCIAMNINITANARALVIGTGNLAPDVGQGNGMAHCYVTVKPFGGSAVSVPGSDSGPHFVQSGTGDSMTLVGISAPLTPGDYTFTLTCQEMAPINIGESHVTVVMISPF